MSDPTPGVPAFPSFLGAGGNPPPAAAAPSGLSDQDQADLAAFRAAEDDRKAKEQAEKDAISSAELEAFRKFQADQQAAADAEAARRQALVDEAEAEQEAKARRAVEDKARCPKCDAPRNNPSHIGNPNQEYLRYCYSCGFGNGDGQVYPAVEAA